MKVTITYPTWPNIGGFWNELFAIVRREGGDGWCWIQCEDPYTLSLEFIVHLNKNKKEDKFYIEQTTNYFIVCSPYSDQEHWLFTTEKCINSSYECIVKIE